MQALIIEHAQEQMRDVLREKKAPERIRPMGMYSYDIKRDNT